MLNIFAREVRSYFLSPVAYIVTAGFVVLASISFYFRASDFPRVLVAYRDSGLLEELKQNRINLLVLTPTLSDVGYILMFLIPVITMRLWAEEKRGHTDELLLTSPVSVSSVVMGKYLAGLLFVLVLVGITLVYTGFLFYYSAPDPGVTLSSYMALLLFVCSAVGIGLFTSTLTENQIVASVSCLMIELVLATMYGVGESVRSAKLGNIITYISWRRHMTDMFDGVIRSDDLVFFATMIFFWIFLAHQSVESSRWR